jgi:hypothetical protein
MRRWSFYVFGLVCICTGVFVVGVPAHAQTSQALCDELKTPQMVYEKYIEGSYAETFPCMEAMIRHGNYRKNTKTLRDYVFPVLNHYFANIGQNTQFENLLWLLWDEEYREAIENFKWDRKLNNSVEDVVERGTKPSRMELDPASKTMGVDEVAKFRVIYYNAAEAVLKASPSNLISEVDPPDLASTVEEGDKITVTGLKPGAARLLVRDGDNNLAGEAQLIIAKPQITKPFQVALFKPLQIFGEDTSIRWFRLNILYGANEDMSGLDIGLVGHTTGAFSGFGLSSVNFVEGEARAWQWGIVNVAGTMSGFQLGVVNMATTMTKGLQIGLVNVIKSKESWPILPLVNWSF